MLRRILLTALMMISLPTNVRAGEIDLQFTKISDNGSIVDIRNAGDGSERLFLVEQRGRVLVYQDGAVKATPFLDIDARVGSGGERGLLSIAFAPDYAVSGYFYAFYTDNAGDTVLARFSVGNDSDVADPGSEQIVLRVEQPFSNHNGGRALFGPDGMLYLSLGDGGSAGDPANNAQTPTTLLGKILRIDVDPAHGTYAIPPDNPFAETDFTLDEIWALGLRNPWRMSFDRLTGDLYIADVGQNALEEINFQPAGSDGGENYGWKIMEGTSCFSSSNCDQTGLTLPVAEYGHGPDCSVTGGEVYRGSAYPNLVGVYLFADFCSGNIRGLARVGSAWQQTLLSSTGFAVTTFGEGEDGSLYLAAQGDGVYLISDGAVAAEPGFLINPGLNDAWWNPATGGQGFFINVFPDSGTVFLAWFTFDVQRPDESVVALLGEPGHRWFTAFGTTNGNRAVMEIEMTSGGIFDSAVPAPIQQPGGTIVLIFTGCNAGKVVYDIDPPGLQGAVNIVRIAPDNIVICEAML